MFDKMENDEIDKEIAKEMIVYTVKNSIKIKDHKLFEKA